MCEFFCLNGIADLQDKTKKYPWYILFPSLFISAHINAGWVDGKFRWARQTQQTPTPEWMPEYLIYRSHPNMKDPDGVAYVYESCPEFLLYYYRFLLTQQIPMSIVHEELRSLGLLELKPKMYIFYRDVRKSRDPKNDLLKLWVGDEGELALSYPEELGKMEKLRDELLGPKEHLQGGKKGGTAIERSGRGHGNVQGDRCLTFGQSVEAQRGIGHPAGNMSQAHQWDDSMLDSLRQYMKVRIINPS